MPSRPWWQTALLVAVAAMAFVALVLAMPRGPATVVLVAGFAAFIWTLIHNPAFWLRRLAGACFSAALVVATTPAVSGWLDLGSLGALLVHSGGSDWLALGFLAAGLLLAALEVRRETHVPTTNTAPDPASTPVIHQAGIQFAKSRDIELHVRTGPIVGGDLSHVVNGPVTHNNFFGDRPLVGPPLESPVAVSDSTSTFATALPTTKDPEAATTALNSLRGLLQSFYNANGLRMFLATGPNGHLLRDELPDGPMPMLDFAKASVDALERHGLIGAKLFARLRQARTQRVSEIDNVEQECKMAGVWT